MSVQQMMAGVGEAGRNARVSTSSGVNAHCLHLVNIFRTEFKFDFIVIPVFSLFCKADKCLYV